MLNNSVSLVSLLMQCVVPEEEIKKKILDEVSDSVEHFKVSPSNTSKEVIPGREGKKRKKG